MKIGYLLPGMYMRIFSNISIDGPVSPFVKASALLSKSFTAKHWLPTLRKYKCLYVDDISWKEPWEKKAKDFPLEILVAPPASDVNVWKSKWGKILSNLSYIVESQIVVPCKNVDAALHIPEPYVPALDFSWYTWYDISPWHFVDRHLWIIAETPVQLWEAFCQLFTVGAHIDGVLVTEYSSSKKRAWARRPYGKDVECESFGEAIVTSIKNFGDYWSAIVAARGL